MLRVAVLASGRGSNLQALIDARAAGTLPVELVGVWSDRPRASALDRARVAGLQAECLLPRDHYDRLAFDRALFERVATVQPGLIVCAGYMRILSAEVVEPWIGRMLNIHPSLLPAFPGLHTHRRALETGVKVHGATVHFVTAELDDGPIVIQAVVPVQAGDDEAALAARVLAQEHCIYPQAVRWFVDGRLQLGGGRVVLADAIAQHGAALVVPAPDAGAGA